MKHLFFFLAIILTIVTCANSGCVTSERTYTLPLKTESFKDCPIEIDIPASWHLAYITFSATISGRDSGGIAITPLRPEECVPDLAALKSSQKLPFENYDRPVDKIMMEDVQLKNGFGFRYKEPLMGDKEMNMYFVAYVKVKGKCYLIENKDYDDRQNTKWDIEKTMIESIR